VQGSDANRERQPNQKQNQNQKQKRLPPFFNLLLPLLVVTFFSLRQSSQTTSQLLESSTFDSGRSFDGERQRTWPVQRSHVHLTELEAAKAPSSLKNLQIQVETVDQEQKQIDSENETVAVVQPEDTEHTEHTEHTKDTPKTNNTTVAYAVSLIKCNNNKNSPTAGLIDGSLVLRHSIHNISVRNPDSGSKYDYKMYAIVHKQAESCSQPLKDAGFEILVVDAPVKKQDIRGAFVRQRISRAYCCGADEFIKLYAYTEFPEEIFVHVDIDFAFFKPMDHLFDAILYDKDTKEGKHARAMIERERDTDEWPDQIDAFITRDWHQVAPKKFPPGYQAGFMVGRKNPQVLEEVIEIIKEGNYSEGIGMTSGWGNLGYGGYVGAMAMQGVMAYYYDHIRPNTSVELNQCRHNHMGLDVRYNRAPYFNKKYGKKGQCRNASPDDVCEDCMVTEPEKIYSIHYTQCRKPWTCIGTGAAGGKNSNGKPGTAIETNAVRVDHCMMLLQKWHALRVDMEEKLSQLTGDLSILQEGTNGTYNSEFFLGHCTHDGNDGYIRLKSEDESFARLHEIYSS